MKVKKVWSEVSLSATSHESCVQTFVSKPVPTLAHFRCPHEKEVKRMVVMRIHF